jgi:hypothetical protein
MKVYSPAKAVSEKEEAILKLEERTALVTGGINSPETLRCAKIPFSFEVDRYDGQTGKPTV